MRIGRRAATAILAVATALAACAGDAGGGADAVDGYQADSQPDSQPDTEVATGFDDHTVPSFATAGAILAYAGAEQEPAQVKFLIRDFSSGGHPDVHFEEPGFYAMHDEWSWFTLLNGQPIPGYDLFPVPGHSFSTVGEIEDWARGQATLPLDLVFLTDRLYSTHFYDVAFGNDRFFGLGSVLHYAPNPKRPAAGELWLFETEFTDVASEATVARFFEILSDVLPPDVAASLRWLVRGAAQEEVGKSLKAHGSPYGDRWLPYRDLVAQGDFKSYNPGVAAGRIHVIRKGETTCATLLPTDVVILEEVPDDIPPVAAIITAVPQTPLAHVGLLAKARGTPNAYVAGILDHPMLDTWEYYRKPLIVEVAEDAAPRLVEISYCGMGSPQGCSKDWEKYLSLLQGVPPALQAPDVAGMPLTVDLTQGGLADMAGTLPSVGGKAAGYLGLNDAGGVDLPDGRIALTVKGYVQHVARLDPPLSDVLADQWFAQSPENRYLVLEGRDAFVAAFAGCASATTTLEWFDQHFGSGSTLGRAVAQGGIRQMIRALPVDPAYLDAVTAALVSRFAFLAHSQGLRFRSSSTTEDILGFNGAGLFESHTAYLFPEEQPPNHRDDTVEATMKEVWASYWLPGAYEERANAGIDHLKGRMGIVVHANFDDDLELSNGVATLDLVRRPEGDSSTLVANVQAGDLSVTNPPPGSGALPEIDVASRVGGGATTIERKQASTEVPAGTLLLSDAGLESMRATLAALASAWLDARNAPLAAYAKETTITLDVEFRRMAPGWPARSDGVVNPERFVYKQSRTLETPVRGDASIRGLPLPRDLLTRVRRAEEHDCELGWAMVRVPEVYTDPAQPWPFPYGKEPFTTVASFSLSKWPEGFAFPKAQFALYHHQAAFSHPGMAAGGPWVIEVAPNDPVGVGFAKMRVEETGAWTIESPAGKVVSGNGVACTRATIGQTPSEFLRSVLDAAGQ
jgi:hypothetical protein